MYINYLSLHHHNNKLIHMIRKYCSVKIKSTGLLTCLSVSTMCLLIYASIVIITVISITPIIILGLGEISAGQRDVILFPADDHMNFINTTKITQLSQQIAMPRLQMLIGLNEKGAKGWFIDFDLEQQHHLGTLPIFPEPNQQAHYIYVHSQFGFNENQKLQVHMKQHNQILNAIVNQMKVNQPQHYNQIIQQITQFQSQLYNVTAEFQVISVYYFQWGKFGVGQAYGSTFLNISSAFQHMMNSTFQKNKINSKYFLNYLYTDFNLADYSTECTINLPNRIQVYSNQDYQQTYNTLSDFGANILTKIGLFSVQSEIPIGEDLITMSYFGMFIGVILKLIIISLFTLSILMMNNMLNVGIQRKSFDFAVIKTMGANRIYVILNLLFDSMKYVLMSNLLAFPFAYITLHVISGIFVTFFGYRYDVQPTLGSILGGFFIGVLVPIISAIAPIWGVINNDLAENLNPIRNKTQSIKTQIYIEGGQFPFGKMIYGILASTFGIMIYYLLPKGLVNQDISLLLFVFFTILVGLLLGLILLSYSFQYLFEQLVAYLTLFWTDKTDFKLTMKNMSAHRMKNRKTSLLYALSVAMVIFVSVGISIQIQTISEEMLKHHGTYLEIKSPYGYINKDYYDKLFATKFQGQVLDWAYQTVSLNQRLKKSAKVENIMFSDKARLYFKQMNVYGVSPNYLKVMPNSDTIPLTSSYAYQPYDPYQFLYSPEGYMTCTISSYAAKKFNILNSDNRQFLMNFYTESAASRLKLSISSVFEKRAGLAYSGFQFGRQQIGVSFDTYMHLGVIRSSQNIPYEKIKIKVADPQNTQELANKIRNQMNYHNFDSLWDYSQVQVTINKIKTLLQHILTVLLVLVLLISFFSLVTTSFINIINQSTQIAILMTLGYSKLRISKIFVYEAFVLVLNSCLIGVAVGIFVAWMMGLQRQLFGDFPVSIEVNGLWIIGIAAILSSILSTIKPLRDIFKQSINQIFQYS